MNKNISSSHVILHHQLMFSEEQYTTMFQWMGGSRRKVITSRKSTQNRQKQYFEQRKRRQQVSHWENVDGGRHKRILCNDNLQSLDIASMMNLAECAQGHESNRVINGMEHEKADNSQLNHRSSFLPPTALSEKINLGCTFDSEEANNRTACFKAQMLTPEKFNSGKTYNETTDAQMPVSMNCKELDGQKDVIDKYPSIFELLGDDESHGLSVRSSGHEPHVSFSVQGLGQIEAHTPVCTPKGHSRIFHGGISSPSKIGRGHNSSASHWQGLADCFDINLDELLANGSFPLISTPTKSPLISRVTADRSEVPNSNPIEFSAVDSFDHMNHSPSPSWEFCCGMDRDDDFWQPNTPFSGLENMTSADHDINASKRFSDDFLCWERTSEFGNHASSFSDSGVMLDAASLLSEESCSSGAGRGKNITAFKVAKLKSCKEEQRGEKMSRTWTAALGSSEFVKHNKNCRMPEMMGGDDVTDFIWAVENQHFKQPTVEKFPEQQMSSCESWYASVGMDIVPDIFGDGFMDMKEDFSGPYRQAYPKIHTSPRPSIPIDCEHPCHFAAEVLGKPDHSGLLLHALHGEDFHSDTVDESWIQPAVMDCASKELQVLSDVSSRHDKRVDVSDVKDSCSGCNDDAKGEVSDHINGPEIEKSHDLAQAPPSCLKDISENLGSVIIDKCEVDIQPQSRMQALDGHETDSRCEGVDCEGAGHLLKDHSYQVMLERYVLQLLCVTKVLKEVSERDALKKS